jgi:hypothetical protein
MAHDKLLSRVVKKLEINFRIPYNVKFVWTNYVTVQFIRAFLHEFTRLHTDFWSVGTRQTDIRRRLDTLYSELIDGNRVRASFEAGRYNLSLIVRVCYRSD